MANSIIAVPSVVLPFILSLFFSNAMMSMHAASSNNIVSTICQRTINLHFCSNLLKSVATTDLKPLATFTLNLAHSKATETRALAQSLASKTADPKLKERYASCAEHYDVAASNINDAKIYLAEGDYNGVNIQASGTMMEVDDCQENFTHQPVDRTAVFKNAKALEDICSVILVIANLLLGRV